MPDSTRPASYPLDESDKEILLWENIQIGETFWSFSREWHDLPNGWTISKYVKLDGRKGRLCTQANPVVTHLFDRSGIGTMYWKMGYRIFRWCDKLSAIQIGKFFFHGHTETGVARIWQ